MSKRCPKIIHCIDSLSMGGAEVLLKNTLELLPEFNHLIICLDSGKKNKVVPIPGIRIIYLEHRGWSSLITTVMKLKKIFKQEEPLLIHSHLFYSTLCARLALPRATPLVSTLHSLYSKDAFDINRKSILAEKMTIRKKHTIIAVSEQVLQDYLNYVDFKGNKYILHNFLPYLSFNNEVYKRYNKAGRFVAVGNLKAAKNYSYLLKIFGHLKKSGLALDIYGEGLKRGIMEQEINDQGLNISLCGTTEDVPRTLDNYDFFIQASSHEGFGISVIEAMANGIPVFLSDIPVFREITNGLAIFFPLDDSQKAAEIIIESINNIKALEIQTNEAKKFVSANYSAEKYREKLLHIYNEITGGKILEQCVA